MAFSDRVSFPNILYVPSLAAPTPYSKKYQFETCLFSNLPFQKTELFVITTVTLDSKFKGLGKNDQDIEKDFFLNHL